MLAILRRGTEVLGVLGLVVRWLLARLLLLLLGGELLFWDKTGGEELAAGGGLLLERGAVGGVRRDPVAVVGLRLSRGVLAAFCVGRVGLLGVGSLWIWGREWLLSRVFPLGVARGGF